MSAISTIFLDDGLHLSSFVDLCQWNIILSENQKQKAKIKWRVSRNGQTRGFVLVMKAQELETKKTNINLQRWT